MQYSQKSIKKQWDFYINVGKRHENDCQWCNTIIHFYMRFCILHKFDLTCCSIEFCFLWTKNLTLHGFLPDSVVAFFTSQPPNTKHLFNHCFSQKMCLIVQLERNSFSLSFTNLSHFHKAVICLQADLKLWKFTK